jgi:hypothetical protein
MQDGDTHRCAALWVLHVPAVVRASGLMSAPIQARLRHGLVALCLSGTLVSQEPLVLSTQQSSNFRGSGAEAPCEKGIAGVSPVGAEQPCARRCGDQVRDQYKGVCSGNDALDVDPLLVPSAVKAVKQWRFKPYLLNGHSVEVETQTVVSYTLSLR